MQRFIVLVFALIGMAVSVANATEADKAVAAANKSPRNRNLSMAAANALRKEGRITEAIPFYKKGTNAANLALAEIYFDKYDFGQAEKYLSQYLEKRTKAEAESDQVEHPNGGGYAVDWADYLESRIELGASMLDRVEKIQVVDSVNVPSDGFYQYMKLAKSSGQLSSSDVLESILDSRWLQQKDIATFGEPVYQSERADDVFWVGADADGEKSTMYESVMLSDGSWDIPAELFDYKSVFGDNSGSWVDYPFLMSDGVTLYFAADGDNSLGGLDIFISRRDERGFLQPSNIGMPYNSTGNDFMLAIDEETGAGWWVTDRNGLGDSVTIYTFIPNELRANYPVDTPNLTGLAKLNSIKDTQTPDIDYASLIRKIKSIPDQSPEKGKTGDLNFAIPGNGVYHSVADFKNAEARQTMAEYLKARQQYAETETRLSTLRTLFAKGNSLVSAEILELEAALNLQRNSLKQLRNQVITLEQ